MGVGLAATKRPFDRLKVKGRDRSFSLRCEAPPLTPLFTLSLSKGGRAKIDGALRQAQG